jgi:hypothetical protein
MACYVAAKPHRVYGMASSRRLADCRHLTRPHQQLPRGQHVRTKSQFRSVTAKHTPWSFHPLRGSSPDRLRLRVLRGSMRTTSPARTAATARAAPACQTGQSDRIETTQAAGSSASVATMGRNGRRCDAVTLAALACVDHVPDRPVLSVRGPTGRAPSTVHVERDGSSVNAGRLLRD